MTYAIIKNETLEDIADATRAQTGFEGTYLPSEIPDAILGIAGGAAFQPQPVTGISAKVGHGQVGLLFDDPEDLSYLGYDIYEWAGTKVVRKADSAPSSQSDGTLVANSTTHDAHVSSYLVDTGLTDGTTYYYGLFPYTTEGVYNTDPSQIISATPSALGVGTASSLAAKVGSGKATLTWSDPTDVGDTASRYGTAWAKTELVRKEGSVPSDPSDGTLVATSTTRNQYSSTGFTDTGLTNGTTYYYGAFAYSSDGIVSNVVAVAVTPSALGVGSCTNLAVSAGNATADITWSDPSNVADTSARYGANWARTVLVRKAGSAPSSPSDGTVVVTSTTRNQYSTTAYNDTGLTNGTEYYYAAFAVSSDGVTSTAATASATPTAFDPSKIAFSTATIDELALMLEKAYAGDITLSDYWHVGDTRTVAFAGASNSLIYTSDGATHSAQDIEIAITGFNRYTIHGDTKKALVTFAMVDCLKERSQMNSTNTNAGGWNASGLRTFANGAFRDALPSDFKALVKQVDTVAASGTGTGKVTSADYFFPPSEVEVFGSVTYANATAEADNSQMPYYTDTAERVKHLGKNGSADYFWERSAHGSDSRDFCNVYSDGSANWGNASYYNGVSFAGCL